MIVRICVPSDPFARVPKSILDDVRLSWKAKGILAYLLGKPDDWQVQTGDIIKKATDGRDAVQAAFKELRTFGYAELRGQRRRSDGTMGEMEWIISYPPTGKENPQPEPGFPEADNPVLTKKDKKLRKKGAADFPIPEVLDTPAFREVWAEWAEHRKQKRSSLTPVSKKKQLTQLAALGVKRAIAALNHSMQQGYTGIFEPNATDQKHPGRNAGTFNDPKYRGKQFCRVTRNGQVTHIGDEFPLD